MATATPAMAVSNGIGEASSAVDDAMSASGSTLFSGL
jgi:hypothetical protein